MVVCLQKCASVDCGKLPVANSKKYVVWQILWQSWRLLAPSWDSGSLHFLLAGISDAQAGYYCSVCECILRDSQSYLDHINGKFHNRALGMSMRVERSTANDVRHIPRQTQVSIPLHYRCAEGFALQNRGKQL